MEKNKLFKLSILFTLIIFLASCSKIGSSNKNSLNDIVIEDSKDFLIMLKDEYKPKKQPYFEMDSNIDILDIFYENEDKPDLNIDKYSSITKDKKIDWDSLKTKEYSKKYLPKDIANKLNINNQKINLSMKFTDLDNQFSQFDKIVVSRLYRYSN